MGGAGAMSSGTVSSGAGGEAGGATESPSSAQEPNGDGGAVNGLGGSSFGGSGFGGSGFGGSGASGGGSAGVGGALGMAGATGEPEDLSTVAAVLDGFALLKPCVDSFVPSGNPNNAGDCCCEEEAVNENQHITATFGGEPDVTYEVTLRVAGVAERYWYSGGEVHPSSDEFYIGGRPTIHGPAPNEGLSPGEGACKVRPPETDGQYALPFTVPDAIRPTDGCYNGFNIFAMTVSAPEQSYYLNHTTDFDGSDRQPHSIYSTDYTVTLQIQGQAQLDFYTIDGDHHQVTNNGTLSLPNLRTEQPYNGNFLELTVQGVTVVE
jgi:hypothetical protein